MSTSNLQVTGYATIAKSSKMSPKVKGALLKAPKGQERTVTVPLYDADGNKVCEIHGGLRLSKNAGSITCNFAMKVPFTGANLGFRAADKEARRGAKTEADKRAESDALATLLLQGVEASSAE